KEDKMSLDLKLVEQIVNVCKSLPVGAIKGRFSVRLAIKKDLVESKLIAIGHSLIDKWVIVEDSSIVDWNGLQAHAKTDDISIFETYTN
ncbi:MAG: hypothetical protein IKL08_00920, partial [Clostridia bacterium]|nr:hypothetical protein [Clostridia bacterium]